MAKARGLNKAQKQAFFGAISRLIDRTVDEDVSMVIERGTEESPELCSWARTFSPTDCYTVTIKINGGA